MISQSQKSDTATFGTGCFWCTEAIFSELKGVVSVTPGYSGGRTKDPTYKEVCAGTTGHAEVVQICFDPALITFSDLLEVFWHIHDPTTLNRQGNDVGPQYRSVIFFHSDLQMTEALKSKERLKMEKVFKDPIVTEISPFVHFYPAEKYHEDYYRLNPSVPYCKLVIEPKVQKFREYYKLKIK